MIARCLSSGSAVAFRLRGLLFLVGGVSLLGLAVRSSLADPTGPLDNDHNITVAVTSLLKRDHLSRHPLDNEMSERWMKMYLKTLDPMKVYFTQADVDAFNQRRDDLDDMAKRGDVSFGYVVFRRFLERVDERVAIVEELLKTPPDFTLDEELITDPELLHYAQNPDEVREIWRKRIKFDLLALLADKSDKAAKSGKEEKNGEKVEKPSKVDTTPPQEKLLRRYKSFSKRMHQTDNDELLEMYLTALTTSYDPHTTYMSPDSVKNFRIMMSLELEGIGAALIFNEGYTVVNKIIPGGAADKDKRLQPEDRIIGVGEGVSGEIEDVMDMKLNDVVKKIRGKRGTSVRLKVTSAALPEPRIITIVRDKIALTDSEARSEVIDAGKRQDGAPFRVGVINLPSFYMDMSGAREGLDDFKSTTRDVARLLQQFNRDNVDVCVLDLRKNGGGSLTEAINLTGLFIDSGPVVQVKDADKRVTHYDDPDKSMLWSKPLVVVIDKFSASASEIFAGAIQDYHRGLIVGDRSTHGKGTVQSLLDLGSQLSLLPNPPQLGDLKITMQQFYRPNGDSTQNRGVLSDVELPSLSTQYDVGESSLDYALKFDQVPPVGYRKVELVNAAMVDYLKRISAERRKGSKEWDRVELNIARYNEQKKRKRVSLNQEKFNAERAELNAEREEEKELDEMSNPNRPIFKRDYYSDEVLKITQDYVRLLHTPPAQLGQRR